MIYDVIGFPKSGSVSTQKWLESRGHDCTKSEWPFLWNIERIKAHLGDRIPVLVIRNKPDALWSFYEYFGYKGKIPFEDFLNIRVRGTNFLNFTPLEIFDYDRWINKLEPLKPIIYKLEEIRLESDYPHENKTMLKSNIPTKYLNSIQF